MIIPGVVLDEKQQELITILENIITSTKAIASQSPILRILDKIMDSPNQSLKNSIYIYGGVGRGKSMIADVFYNELSISKLFMHYQNFMQNIHDSLHKHKGSTHDIIVKLARNMAKQYRYICIDEFEVQDVADAMIISRLFKTLRKEGVNILITSNVEPEQLYKHGLQREQFLPFIDMVKKEFTIFPLDGKHDYRLDKIIKTTRIFYHNDKEVAKKFKDIIDDITGGHKLSPTTLEIFGRKVVFPHTYKTVLVTNFDALCRNPFSSNDFVEIGKYFSIVVMENVPYISKDETDVIIRFINFIDNIYFRKILLFISLADSPEKIYPVGRRVNEFQRTISRLHEMNSESYFMSAKHQ